MSSLLIDVRVRLLRRSVCSFTVALYLVLEVSRVKITLSLETDEADVDEGNTVMDYLPAERERGITIQSAAITFPWRDHRLNLIDTPGHADFTFEVERSLRVLDGAVTILDAVAGVEAQTEKVWKQADGRQLPRIVFINKMDRTGAGFGRTVNEIASKLRARPLVLQLPIFDSGLDGGTFIGVLDLLTEQCLVWPSNSDGKEVQVTPIAEYSNPDLQAESVVARTALVETLSELDEDVVNAYLEHEDIGKIPIETLRAAIRRVCLFGSVVPVFAGASFRNIGVQPLLDAIVAYLPSPLECPPVTTLVDGKRQELKADSISCALAFKVIVDPQRGPMVFVRVYSGTITRGSTLYNNSSKSKERAMKILQMYADEAREIESISAGNIAVILGLKDTKTGDTLILAKDSKNNNLSLQAIDIPPPVFIATLETNSLSESKSLELALDNLLREDPSLRINYEEETGQTLLSGMGELHLEIAGTRLVNDFKAKVEMGKLRIGYRETVNHSTSLSDTYERILSNGRSSVFLRLDLGPLEQDSVMSKSSLTDGNLIEVSIPEAPHAEFSAEDARLALQNGASAALSRGLVLGYPMHSVHLRLGVERYESDTSLGALSSASRTFTQRALESIGIAGMSVLEPIMSVSIAVDDTNVGSVMNDLTGARAGQVLSLDDPDEVTEQITSFYAPPDITFTVNDADLGQNRQKRVIQARVSLKEMVGYSRALRTLTGGRGSFTMSVDKFEPMNDRALQQLRSSVA